MDETQVIALLQEARPIFEIAEKHGYLKLDENLQFGQAKLLENIETIWFGGRNGPEIEEFCRKAGLKSRQVKQVSLYFWYRVTDNNRDTIEKTDFKIYFVFVVLTLIGASIIAWILVGILGVGSTGRRYSDTDVYLIIGLIICTPILGLGLGIRWLVKNYLSKRFTTKMKRTWPERLYPENEEGQADFEK